MIQKALIRLYYYRSFIVFFIWTFSVVILFLLVWNDHQINLRQESDLLVEIRKSNHSMKETEEFRPQWSKILKELEDRQHNILSEMNELHKMKELSLQRQDEILEKLDKLNK